MLKKMKKVKEEEEEEEQLTHLYVPEQGLNNPDGSGSRSNGGKGKPAISSIQKLAPNSLTAWPETDKC